MSATQHHRSGFAISPAKHSVLIRGFYSLAAGFIDAATIVVLSVVSGVLYHRVVYDSNGIITDFAQIGFLVAWLYMLPKILRREYEVTNYLNNSNYALHAVHLWNLAFASLVALAFLTKTGESYSRGWIVMFYGGGMAAIVIVHALVAKAIRAGHRKGIVATRRLFLVGSVSDVRDFIRQYRPGDFGLEILGTAFLPKANDAGEIPAGLDDSLRDAVTYARALAPDDVFIIVPWSCQKIIDECIEAFTTVPASIHLGPEQILDRFENVTIEKIGSVASLHLLRPPLSTTSIVMKRLFDIVFSTVALIVLLPIFIIIGIVIKIGSPGPVFFFQRRYGFNQQMFWIYKFQTMTTIEDGLTVLQATEGDDRITPFGHFLRRWNIDELPQLINVLRGEMSLVGPRPHALTHDEAWGQKIARYARRHNMRPGITGWAQVHGHRGNIRSDADLKKRVLCDFYYIDNWSLWLDIRILWLTIFSPKTYRNAC